MQRLCDLAEEISRVAYDLPQPSQPKERAKVEHLKSTVSSLMVALVEADGDWDEDKQMLKSEEEAHAKTKRQLGDTINALKGYVRHKKAKKFRGIGLPRSSWSLDEAVRSTLKDYGAGEDS